MCGICGFAGVGDGAVVHDMLAAMPYRGPDGIGQWHDGNNLHLGHVRLSIVDIETGHQPLVTPDESLAVVFNGEIYNHRSLRKQLENLGHVFQTDHSDTEVLLYGYRQWGRELTSKLNGMWAFAIYDRENGLLWLSRDRFGEKPLFYAQHRDSFVFSSELGSLSAHPIVNARVDELSLIKYFGYGYVPSPRTILENVWKVPAGHDLVFDLNKRKSAVQRYWRFHLEPDDTFSHHQNELPDILLEELFSAVDLRLEADVPIGVFLSGGIDSSAITAMAVRTNKISPVRSFSIGFEEESFDESGFARNVSRILGTEHYEEVLSVSRCLNILDDIYSRFDEPMGDSALIPSYLMCHAAAGKVKVALGGDGSDELFAGYDLFKALKPASIYSRFVPKGIHQGIEWLASHVPVSHRNMSIDYKLKTFLSALGYEQSLANPIWLGPSPPGQLERLFGRTLDLEEIYSEAIDAWHSADTLSPIDRTIQFYVELYLQNDILVKIDRAGMLNSLEVRTPFLDINLVNLIRKIPNRHKFNGRETKHILKKSLESVLPKEILQRKKAGLSVPIGQWFKEEHLQIDPARFNSVMEAGVVEKIWAEHKSKKSNHRAFLWAYYVLEKWAKQPVFSSSV